MVTGRVKALAAADLLPLTKIGNTKHGLYYEIFDYSSFFGGINCLNFKYKLYNYLVYFDILIYFYLFLQNHHFTIPLVLVLVLLVLYFLFDLQPQLELR